MKRYLIILILIMISCSEYRGDREDINYDSIVINFSGNSGAYITEEILRINVKDSLVVGKLNRLKNLSQPKFVLLGNKGIHYIIRMFFSNSETGDKLIVNIFKSPDSKPVIIYGPPSRLNNTHYNNDELVEYVSDLILLDEIIEFKGPLNQLEYDKLKLE